ncbi:MAG: hypothetical protein ACLR17_06760 [Enterobacteriaceae bacterium]
MMYQLSFFRLALRLAGLRIHRRLRAVARVRRLRRDPGSVPGLMYQLSSSRLALRLAGLQIHRRLRAGSPGKAFTPRPGECAGADVSAQFLPGSRCA